MSTAPRLPTVRLPTAIAGAGSEPSLQDSLLELPHSGKFGFAWPTDTGPAPSLPSLADRHASLSSSDADSVPSEHELDTEVNTGFEKFKTRRWSTGAGKKGHGDESEESDFTTPTNRLNLEHNPLDQVSPPLHRLSRAFSVPLPSQIGHLKNPKRSPLLPSSPGFITPSMQPAPDMVLFHELSLELADSVQMVIQTLLRLSPPQVLDPAKEQFSACALPIPTPSISALFTVMKCLNFMSANMAAFGTPLSPSSCDPPHRTDDECPIDLTISNPLSQAPQTQVHDFDIGETLQSVGDALSGMAADVAVDLVLFHEDVGMKHIAVRGDEIGISYTLSYIVRQILATAHFGDSVQVGLYLVAPVAISPEAGDPSVFEVLLDATEPADATSLLDPNLPLRFTFRITHTFARHNVGASLTPGTSTRTKPSVDSPFLRRLVHHTKTSFTHELTDTAFACELSMTLERGSPAVVNPAIILSENDPILQAFPDFKLSGEPTLEDLSQFVGTLKGKKVLLYANANGFFAQHLTNYLASWGLDVSYVSSDSDAEGSPVPGAATPPFVEYSPTLAESSSGGPILQMLPEQDSPQPTPLTAKAQKQSPSFILIDDDISVLRERLRKLRAELSQPFQLSRKRPTLAANHRPRSSPQVTRAIGHSTPTLSARSAVVILHFTSLANYKLVKGILQSVLGPSSGTPNRMPEVIVIPKPAGPRRVLTALHTAATKPIVDPFFSPIATSPMSPGLYPTASYFSQYASPKSPMTRPSSSPRGLPHQSLRSPRATVESSDTFGLPPSPLGLSEGMDYFSEAAEKLGSSSSSGLVIQSPNGQPAGIFFHPPRSRSSRQSSQSVSVENGPLYSRGSRRRSDSSERSRQSGGVTFLNPPGPTQQRRCSSPQVPLDSVRSGVSTLLDAPVMSLKSHNGTSPGVRPVAKRASAVEGLRKTTSPPSPSRTPPASTSVSSTRRGSGPRRSQFENTSSSSSPMRKVKASEPSIVPPIRVLIVEDNPINQTLLSTFMRKKKIKYDVAKNGEEAVEKWRGGGFHLILMDIQMPVMDGISATKEIRRLEKLNNSQGYPGTPQTEGQRTPSDASNDSRMSSNPFRSSVIVVALTASSLQSDRVAALAAGCNDFLTKPVSLDWLNSKIIEWGSIKALQMFADNRPDFVKSVSAGQTVQAQNIARRLHMPEGRVSPCPSRPLSQPVVPGTSSATGPGPSPSGPDEQTPAGRSTTPSLAAKSLCPIQESSSGTPEWNVMPLGGNAKAKDPVMTVDTLRSTGATGSSSDSAGPPSAEGVTPQSEDGVPSVVVAER